MPPALTDVLFSKRKLRDTKKSTFATGWCNRPATPSLRANKKAIDHSA